MTARQGVRLFHLTFRDFALLAGMAVAGAVVGGGVGKLVLTKYTATVIIDGFSALSGRGGDDAETAVDATASLADIQLFRRVLQELTPGRELNRFLTKRVSAETKEKLEDRLAGGESRYISLEHNYGVTKSDLRDLPDPISRDFGAQLVKSGLGRGYILTTTDRNRETATEMAGAVAGYMEDAALRLQLEELERQWSAESQKEISRSTKDILDRQVRLESLERRMSAMRPLLEQADSESKGPVPTDASVQVQVSGPRFLSVSQQITALASERIDTEEELRFLELNLERLELRKKMGDLFGPLILTDELSSEILIKIEAILSDEAKKILEKPTHIKAELAQFNSELQSLKSRYLKKSPEPTNIRRRDPPLLLTGSLGFVAGIAAFMVSHILRRRREQIAEEVRHS